MTNQAQQLEAAANYILENDAHVRTFMQNERTGEPSLFVDAVKAGMIGYLRRDLWNVWHWEDLSRAIMDMRADGKAPISVVRGRR